MPYRETYTAEPIRRFNSTMEYDAFQEQSDRPQKRLKDTTIHEEELAGLFNIERELGFGLTQSGGIPKDANGNSRMFIIKKDAQGNEKLMAYDGHQLEDGTPLEMNSYDFFDQVQMGNVIAYPLGDNDPVQLQMTVQRNRASFSISKPLVGDDMLKIMDPEPVVPPQPGRFRSLMHRWFNAFDDQFKAREAAVAAHKNWERRTLNIKRELGIKSSQRSLGQVYKEKDEAAAKKEAEKAAAAKAAAEEKRLKMEESLRIAKRVANRIQDGRDASEAIYEPEPKILSAPETEKLFPGRTVKADGVHEKLYTKEYVDEKGKTQQGGAFFDTKTFADLTVIPKSELDLDSIKVGETGRSITKSEFCDLAMFAAMDPEIGMPAFPDTYGYDPTLIDAMKEITVTENGQQKRFFSDKQIDQLVASSFNSVFTTDTRMQVPRGTSGRYVKHAIDPARLKVKEALNEYKNGNPEKLGHIIAVGVNEQAANMTQMSDSMGEEMIGGIGACQTLTNLLDQDPKLKQAAFKAGMKEKNLWVVEGGKELTNLYQKAADSHLKLVQAASDKKELSPEEKKVIVKDIVKGKIATQSLLLENSKAPSPMIDKVQSALLEGSISPGDKNNPNDYNYYDDKNNLIMPPKGTTYIESGGRIHLAMSRYYRPAPGSVMFLKTQTGKENLDTIADQIIAEDKLLELSTEELQKQLEFEPAKSELTYGQRDMQKMAEQGMVSMKLLEELQHEVKTGEAAPKKQAPAQEGPDKQNIINNQEEVVEQGLQY